jgi:hypothetical protein
MNYASVVVVFFTAIATAWYFLAAKGAYTVCIDVERKNVVQTLTTFSRARIWTPQALFPVEVGRLAPYRSFSRDYECKGSMRTIYISCKALHAHLISTSLTSKIKVALPGMSGGAPL